MIDSSPMYGTSEEVIGYCLKRGSDGNAALFSATKVWTVSSARRGPEQMESIAPRSGASHRFDLLQVHNLVEWEGHLETLKRLEGARAGSATSASPPPTAAVMLRLEPRLMTTEPLDFVQFTYNILDREAEKRLLPLAAERGLGVIINRPFRRGALFERFEKKPLPDWAHEFEIRNWAQFFLKFIVSHPAVTCAIPATSRVDHMRENMGAGHGPLPDAKTRARMIGYVESL